MKSNLWRPHFLRHASYSPRNTVVMPPILPYSGKPQFLEASFLSLWHVLPLLCSYIEIFCRYNIYKAVFCTGTTQCLRQAASNLLAELNISWYGGLPDQNHSFLVCLVLTKLITCKILCVMPNLGLLLFLPTSVASYLYFMLWVARVCYCMVTLLSG